MSLRVYMCVVYASKLNRCKFVEESPTTVRNPILDIHTSVASSGRDVNRASVVMNVNVRRHVTGMPPRIYAGYCRAWRHRWIGPSDRL